MPTFTARLEKAERINATGIEIPAAVVEALGQGRRPKVVLTIKGESYRTTVAVMGGRFIVGVPDALRRAAGADAGETLDVTLEADAAPRTVEIPDDLAAALKSAKLAAQFDRLAYTHRKEHVRAITEAKKPETRARRIDRCVEMLRAGVRAGV